MPLGLYLLSFVICFDHEQWYWPRTFATLLLLLYVVAAVYAAMCASAAAHPNPESNDSDRIQEMFKFDVAASFLGLFFICLLCHGEVVRLKPHPRYLTSFYLLIAAGGAIGGLFVSLIAPMVFAGFTEWYIALVGGCLLAVTALLGTAKDGYVRQYPKIFVPGLAILAVGMIWGALAATRSDKPPLEVVRNFYGTLTVQARRGRKVTTTKTAGGQQSAAQRPDPPRHAVSPRRTAHDPDLILCQEERRRPRDRVFRRSSRACASGRDRTSAPARWPPTCKKTIASCSMKSIRSCPRFVSGTLHI